MLYPVFVILTLLFAHISEKGVQGSPPCLTVGQDVPLCSSMIRPYSENACFWQNVCGISVPADTLIAYPVEQYDEGYDCNPGYVATCCASLGDCAAGIGCDMETSQPYPPSDPSDVDLPAGWSAAVPCAVDDASRVLTDVVVEYLPSGNSPDICATHCQSLGYNFAGVEYSDECYCGTGLVSPIEEAPNSDCDMCCTLPDNTNTCGGSWRMQIYSDLNVTV